ncbi:unnamed protein product [Bursaphelenchus xylophilus]|uniref:(pine wood nematode) hypothetical protein n=1 Tax=Bursaphelenchus xylophilus TaxID=6326 RepID=A0A1I7RJ17_BURXY|nr:unnamed protein product [Bursaphelenchus xylophilus]CAG9119256.1 unnamed protein product [Bursaphelenchus xylophilus]
MKKRVLKVERKGSQCDCQVCGRPTRAYFHKLFVCCACTMFYRRNFRAFLRSQCRTGDGGCDLSNGPRRFCLYCRLNACRKLGLRMLGKNLVVQTNGLPADDISEEQLEEAGPIEGFENVGSPSTSSGYGSSYSGSSGLSLYPPSLTQEVYIEPSDGILDFLGKSAIELPKLRLITNAFRQLDDQQKFLATMQRGSEMLDYACPAEELIYCDRIQYEKMESKVIRIACMTLNRLIDAIQPQMDIERRTEIIQNTSVNMSLMHKILCTFRQFPEMGQSLSSPFTGYYSDLNDLDAYLADVWNEKVDIVMRRFHADIYTHYTPCLEEARYLMVHPVECAYLAVQATLEKASDDVAFRMFSEGLDHEFATFLQMREHFESAESRIHRLKQFQNNFHNFIAKYIDCHGMIDLFLSESKNVEERRSVWLSKKDLQRYIQAASSV